MSRRPEEVPSTDSLPRLLLLLIVVPVVIGLLAGLYFARLPSTYAATATIEGAVEHLARANRGATNPVVLMPSIDDNFTVISAEARDEANARAAILDFVERGKALPFQDDSARATARTVAELSTKDAATLELGLVVLERIEENGTLSAADRTALTAVNKLVGDTIEDKRRSASQAEREMSWPLIDADVEPQVRMAFRSGNWIMATLVAGSFAFILMLLVVLEHRQRREALRAASPLP